MKIDPYLFQSVNPGYKEIFEYGRLIVMSHYAMETWHDMRKGTIHLHGHSHGKLKTKTRRLDVGVDTHDFRPWSLDEVFTKMKLKRKFPDREQVSLF
jgi:calcineurin-like phosphoesterase family protein